MIKVPVLSHKKKNKSGFILGILFFSMFFSFGISEVEAAPIKILSNSRHAMDYIGSTIDQLLGRAHNPVTEFVIHSTSMSGSVYSGSISEALSSATRYDESGAAVSSQAPYHIYTSSFTGYSGDFSTTNYNLSATYDLADNYAYITSSSGAAWLPPAFRIAPSVVPYTAGPGIEWALDPGIFASSSLSALTAANSGMVAVLRFNHPPWNWFDTKAALRQTGTNWTTGYNSSTYGFGQVNYTTANALSDNQVLLQPPPVATSTTGIYPQITFTVYPFKQTRRVKEVLFQFASNPGFQANELTLAEIEVLGGTKITEYTGTTATTTIPLYGAVTNAYFVWFTTDNSTDRSANFSRIDTYNVLGPLSQSEVHFSSTFNISSPANNAISATASPTFTWGAADSYLGISKYQLFIDGALDKDNITGTSATPTGSLSEGAHTWYIKAFNGGGTSTTTTSTPTLNVISGYASGYTFYVDNVLGGDTGVGSQAAPWATLTKAGLTVNAGDMVIITKNASTPYRETLTPLNSGTVGLPITFRGVDVNTKPEIWGSTDVSSGWSVYSGGNANTYQKSLTTQAQVVAAGPSIINLTKKTQGASAATLNPGEWQWTSSVLYYRLDSGENISTLHIEAGARSTGISGGSFKTYKNIIVRYANVNGVSLGGNSIAEGLEIYDSGLGINIGSGATARYCIVAGNNSYGFWSQYASPIIYNSLAYGNGTSGFDFDVLENSNNATVKNNTSSGNMGYSFFFNYYFNTPSAFTSSNNAWDIAGDSRWDTHKGTNNQELKDSLFISTSTRNFRLEQFSPNIDSGIAISSLTTDILGNPIYGTPDIGPYEYQPPYTITGSGIPLNGSLRVYKDGKYRMTVATSSTATASLYITPADSFSSSDYSEWLNVTVNTWNTSGDYTKSWTESSSSAGSTVHTVGDLAPNGFYAVSVDGTRYAQFRADSGGQGTFTYSGGYSTHTFSIAPDLSIGNGPPVGIFGSVNTQPTLTPAAIAFNQLAGTTTTLVATTTSPTTSSTTTTTINFSSTIVTKEKIAELQGKLIILLKQLVVLLTEDLQNIKKTI